MTPRHTARKILDFLHLQTIKITDPKRRSFTCPICHFHGPFFNVNAPTGRRLHAICPKCRSLERHRVQFHILEHILKPINASSKKILHFAPERFFRDYFSTRFQHYESADLFMKDVDHKVDIQMLPFPDETYDFVFASHVLEHITDDKKAISEIRRVLRPSGIAVLPVPIVAEKTIEYPNPIASEYGHVRAPGFDYFGKYRRYFSRVDEYTSDDVAEDFQPYIWEDRSKWPTPDCPLRLPIPGSRHADVVPVCFV